MASVIELWIGRRDTGVRLWPDGVFPILWRICWPDGALSPMGNISRAKEAAILFARPRGLGGHAVARWHVREIASEAPLAARKAVAVGRVPRRPACALARPGGISRAA
jgi:hypothetical protein